MSKPKLFKASTLIQLPKDQAILTEEAAWITEVYLDEKITDKLGYTFDFHPKNYGYIRTKEYLLKTRYSVSVKRDPEDNFYWENYFVFPCELDIDTIDTFLVGAVEKVYDFLKPLTEYVYICSYTEELKSS